MKRLLLLCFLLLFLNSAQAQSFLSRYLNRIIKDSADVSQPQYLIFPTIAYAPETSWEFGLSALYVFYTNRDTLNRLSEIRGFTFYTLETQYGLYLDNAIYTNKNKWFFLGSFRYQSFPLLYHGIGIDTPEDFIAEVEGRQVQFKQRGLRKIRKNFYIGPELDFQSLNSVNFIPEVSPAPEIPNGGNGSLNLGLGLGLIFDNRHNVLNVRKGAYSELAFLRYDDLFGSEFNFTSVILDNRLYFPINKRDVFATQIFGQFNSGNIPFNQLALLGGETIMRGYYYGRYRDKNLMAFQLEYRFLPLPLGFTKRVGAAVFAGTGTVYNNFSNLKFDDLVYAGGAGLRFLLFPKKDIYIRSDFAFTEEGHGIYILVGEAF